MLPSPLSGQPWDAATCEAAGRGDAQLCAVWRDPDFDATQSAYYYARALQDPTCRWSQRQCVAAGVDCARQSTITEGFEACCDASHQPLIQERAWTSPIWYEPSG